MTKPTNVKILQGTFQKCRENKDEPKHVKLATIPAPPRKLKGEARKEWDRVIAYVASNDLVGEEGLSALATYCNFHAAVVAAERKGEILIAAHMAQYRAFISMFGLDPQSRSRLRANAPKEKDPDADEFF